MWFLALRQMLAKKRQTFLIFLGITFGTMIYIIIAGLQFGMREYLSEQLLNNTAHVIISGNERLIVAEDLRQRFFPEDWLVKWISPPSGKREESRLENPQGWFNRLGADPQVVAFAPRLTINSIMSKHPLRQSVVLTGIIPDRYMQVTSLEDYVTEGNLLSLHSGSNNVIIGSGIAEQIGARVDQTVSLSIGAGEPRPFKIVGIFSLGNEHFDKSLALAHINDVQTLNRTPGRVSEISVALTDINQSAELAKRWALLSTDKVQGWEEANAAFMQVIKIQDVVRMVITGALLLVSAFGIYNVLSIMISQKQKEIAILRSIGYAPGRIMNLILIQGLTLGFLGATTGLLIGYGINLYIGTIDLGFKIGKGTTLLVSNAPNIYITAFWAAMASSAVASILPARHAASLTPLEIIRSNL